MGNIVDFNKFKKSKSKKVSKEIPDSLTEYTVDSIHNYYLNQAMFFGTNALSDDIFDNIDSIMLINTYDDEVKDKFIELAKFFGNLKHSMLTKIRTISDLTDIFLYLNKEVLKYDIDTLKSMTAFKTMNKMKMDDVLNIYKTSDDSINGGMRM